MKVYNFSPGPAKLDSSIISKSQEAMYNFQNTGLSILEIGHRSKEFEKLIKRKCFACGKEKEMGKFERYCCDSCRSRATRYYQTPSSVIW